VARVRDAWLCGERVPLDLSPLLVTSPHQESGGMLFHRPSNPDCEVPSAGHAALRRYHPCTLPVGLVQVVGHTGHRKCLQVFGDWVTPEAAAHKVGGIRTLRVVGDTVRYHLGCLPHLVSDLDVATDLIMIDGEMRAVAGTDYALLQVAALA
jgi:hypothetical protein